MPVPSFLQDLCFLAAGFSMVLAVVLVLTGEARAGAPPGRLTGAWRALAGVAPAGVLERPVLWLAHALERAVGRWFSHADRGDVANALFGSLFLVVVPLLAGVNALLGGSPWLITLYGLFLAAAVALNFSAEIKWLAPVNAALAMLLGAGMVVYVPLYVARSFTDAILGDSARHAALESLLMVPIWWFAAFAGYQAAAHMLTWLRPAWGSGAGARLLARFGAALPVALVLFFAVLAVAEQAGARPWAGLAQSHLLLAVFSAALAFALALGILIERPSAPGIRAPLTPLARLLVALVLVAVLGLMVRAWSASHFAANSAAQWVVLPVLLPGVLLAATVASGVMAAVVYRIFALCGSFADASTSIAWRAAAAVAGLWAAVFLGLGLAVTGS